MEREEHTGNIYVVGFPKSGNTWLTRLLADVLRVPVRSEAQKQGAEIASGINDQLGLVEDGAHFVAKIHYLPEPFLRDIDRVPRRIAYIYRDVRDVMMSSFFYLRALSEYEGTEEDVLFRSRWRLFLTKPLGMAAHLRNRETLRRYVERFCRGDFRENTSHNSAWDQHIREWRAFFDDNPDVEAAFVSYEELLEDAETALRRVIGDLGLADPGEERIAGAVGRQSLEAQRERLRQMEDDADIPLGKETNLRFLRKGVSGDWRNYLSPDMGKIIQDHLGDLLLELEYETNPTWYEALRPV